MFKDDMHHADAGTVEALSAVEGPNVTHPHITHNENLSPASLPNQPVTQAVTQGGFEQPAWMWTAMFGCYALFFLSILLATGRDSEALFVIIISVLYALFYFGVAGVLGALQGTGKASPLERGDGTLDTWTGPMTRSAVAAQILSVPLALALFGVMFAIIRAIMVP